MLELTNHSPELKLESAANAAALEADTVKALLALAQTHRLRVFRALVVAGSGGLTPGALAASLGIAPTSLSFHLKELVNANLATREAQSRNLIYRAQYLQMTALLAYLTEHCCMGAACEVTPQPPAPGCC